MAESLVLFESVINSRWFLRTSIILFMNKIDLFAAKLPKVPLEKFFSDYTGKLTTKSTRASFVTMAYLGLCLFVCLFVLECYWVSYVICLY